MFFHVRTTPAGLLLVGLCVAPAVFADSPDAPLADTVIVTADRVPQALEEIPASVRTVDRAALDRLPVRTVGDALATLPNVAVRQSGALFDEASLTLYGISGQPRAPSRTVVAVGGVPLNSGLVPETSVNLIPVALVERIELIQGPGSAAYGSNATTGVLNLVPRQPEGWLLESDLQVGTRWDTYGADLRIGHGAAGQHGWIAGISRRSTDGHLQPGGRKDYSDSKLTNGAVLGWRNWGAWTIDGAWLRYDFDRHDPSALLVGIPAGPTAREEIGHRTHASIGARWQINDSLSSELRYLRNSASVRDAQTFRQPAIGPAAPNPAYSATVSDGWLAQLTWTTERHRLATGIEYQSAELQDVVASTTRNGSVRGLFAQYQLALLDERLLLSAGYRYDDISTYSQSSDSPKIGLVWRSVDGNWRWRVNVAKAFNAPTFVQLFSTGGVRGNRNLRAQTLRLTESGLTWRVSAAVEADLALFDARLRDPIFPRPNPALGPGIRQFQNVGPEVNTQGAVLSATWRPTPAFTLQGSYQYLDPGTATFHTAEHTGKVQLGYDRGRSSWGVALRHESNRYWRDGFLNPTSDYTVIDAQIGWRLNERLRADLGLYNVTNETYATTASIGATSSVDLLRPRFHGMLKLSATL